MSNLNFVHTYHTSPPQAGVACAYKPSQWYVCTVSLSINTCAHAHAHKHSTHPHPHILTQHCMLLHPHSCSVPSPPPHSHTHNVHCPHVRVVPARDITNNTQWAGSQSSATLQVKQVNLQGFLQVRLGAAATNQLHLSLILQTKRHFSTDEPLHLLC